MSLPVTLYSVLTSEIHCMATAKKSAAPAKKVVPIVLSKSRALQPWEQEMANAAKKAKMAEKLTGLKTINTRGGIMKIDDEPVEGNALRCVVLSSLHENQWFDRDFDASKPASPACYAYGDPKADEPDADMRPHEKAKDKQCEACNACEFNKMGSAEKGKGKACKNVRRLALITEDALESPAALSAADIRLLKVPVMSTNGWAKYVHTLADDMQRLPWGVVTEVSLHPDDKSQFKVAFEFQELVNFDQELYEAMKKKSETAMSMLLAPYPDLEEEEKPARRNASRSTPPARGKPGVKTVPAKPGAKKAKY